MLVRCAVRSTNNFNFHVKRFTSNQKNPNLTSLLLNMPKEKKHIAETQYIRRKIKDRRLQSGSVPSRVTLQVLGTGAKGAPGCLYIFSDNSRYLFNCGEGTQRLAHEHKIKIAKLEHIFVTQPIWKNIGGLLGTALTIQDVGVPDITLHGPEGLEELFNATKRFVILKDLKVTMASCTENSYFEDNVIKVWYVLLEKNWNNKSTCEPENIECFNTPNVSDETLENSSVTLEKCNGVDKFAQAGTSMDLVNASTSTLSKKTERRKRRNSRSMDRSTPELESSDDEIDYYAYERKKRYSYRKRSRSQSANRERSFPSPISDSKKMHLSRMKQLGICMTYICRLQPKPGALSLEKCVEYGVPPGPILGRLKNGEDVTLESGVVVQSKDVCDPPDAGPIFIVIDCPSEEYLDSLEAKTEFAAHQKSAQHEEDVATLVVHFTPSHVMMNPRYQNWMNQFPPSTHHLVLNDQNSCKGSVAVHRIQQKLNLLNNHIFPLLSDRGSKVIENELQDSAYKKLKSDSSELPDVGIETIQISSSTGKMTTSVPSTRLSEELGVIQPSTLFNYHLRPRLKVDRSAEIQLNYSEYIKEAMYMENFTDSLADLKRQILENQVESNTDLYPKILFLGTGSCIPSKTRNTSGILLQTSPSTYIIMDCGEGTYGQLVRFFGSEEVDQILHKTQAIYVSHLHADHHLGFIGLLLGRRKALKKTNSNKVMLFAPKQISNWLTFYDDCFETIKDDYELIPNQDLMIEQKTICPQLNERILTQLRLKNIETVYVRHCPNAFGVSITQGNGCKITYSGDTMPSPSLVKLGMNSDILIHEATMEDDLAAEAVIKMHSTMSQAIQIGKEMNAKYTLLTHFSQRYAKIPRGCEHFDSNVGIAFDNMVITINDFPLLHLLYKPLTLMFANDYEAIEQKALKRHMRLERQREAFSKS